MSIRYGDRARSGAAVSASGRRSSGSAGGVQVHRQETFNSPGTWTWPGKVSYVQLLLVGGGGGGGAGGLNNPAPLWALSSGSGGGGGVRYEWETFVDGPVSVTVGAGGAGGPGGTPPPALPGFWPAPSLFGSRGGSSSFGSVSVGGGGGGGTNYAPFYPSNPSFVPAPADGGGAGASLSASTGGTYGCDWDRPSTPVVLWGSGAGSQQGYGRFGYGQGGYYTTRTYAQFAPQPYAYGASGVANTGNGGAAADRVPAAPLPPGGSGGSGVVIVSWWEPAV
jgi:hypothetical protein